MDVFPPCFKKSCFVGLGNTICEAGSLSVFSFPLQMLFLMHVFFFCCMSLTDEEANCHNRLNGHKVELLFILKKKIDMHTYLCGIDRIQASKCFVDAFTLHF